MSSEPAAYTRRVLATAAIYAAAAWAAVEALLTVIDRFGLPPEWGTLVTALFVAGLPVTLYLVWRTAGPERRASAGSITGSILALAVGTAWIYMMTLPEPLPQARAVAVVPCEFQGAQEYAYRAEGLAEDIHARLSRVDSVKISSWNSSLFVHDRGYAPQQIAAVLKVDRLVRCRIESDAGRIALSTEVIDPAANTVLWDRRYDFPTAELGTVITELAGTLLDVLGTPAEAAELERVTDLGTFSSEAYDLFLQAKNAWQWPNPAKDSFDRAEMLITQALEIDPNYAEALVYHADIYMGRKNEQEEPDLSVVRDWVYEARTLAERALELDTGVLGARDILGRVCGTLAGYFDEPCPPEEAERLHREECEIRGDTAAGWACRHRFKAQFGEEGEDNYPELLRWLELEPTSFGGNFQAIFHVWQEQDDPAGGLARFDTLRALYPDDPRPAGGMSNLLRNTGRLDEVLAWRWGSFGDQLPEGNPWSLARLGTDYLDLGMYERALEVGLMTRDTRRFSAIHFVPNLWAGMGELELAAQEWEWGGQALVEAAGSPRAWIQTAEFLVDYARDHVRAKELFDLMIAEVEMAELCGGDPDCLVELPLMLAHNERALGNEDRAKKWLAAAREVAGDGELDGHLAVWMAIAEGRHEDAVAGLREAVFNWGEYGGGGGVPVKLHMLEHVSRFDPLRGFAPFDQLLEDYRAALEPMRQRALEAERNGDWEPLRRRVYEWVGAQES